MELNTKSPFMWDWDNLVEYPSRTADAAKKLQSESEGIVEMGSFHSSGGSGGSVDSSTNRVTVETSDCFSQNVSSRKELGGESLMGLKLGRRTYFEDVVSAPAAVKKSKSTAVIESIHCQVEGCNLDLSSSKDYHRKHRVCENHSKTPKVVICGVERRFCQQCSRFHCLAEFDQKKRSCRRRLSDHNARRRKPKPEIIQFNSVRLPSSLHEGRSLTFNQVPVVQTRPNSSNTTWDFTKFNQAKQCLLPTKSEGFDSMQRTGRHETEFKLPYGSSQAPKSCSTFHQGGGFEVEAGNNELGALSLLSTNANTNGWGGEELDQSGMLLQLNQTRGGIDADYNNQQFQEFQLFKPPPNVPNYYLYEDDLR